MIHLLRFLLSVSFLGIIGGIFFQLLELDPLWMHRLYGGGTLCLFFIWMPVFLVYRLQKTRLLDMAEENRDNWQEKLKDSDL